MEHQFKIGSIALRSMLWEWRPALKHVVVGTFGIAAMATNTGEAPAAVRVSPMAEIARVMACCTRLIELPREGDPIPNAAWRLARNVGKIALSVCSMNRMDPVGQRISMVARLVVAGQTAVGTEVAAVSIGAEVSLLVTTRTFAGDLQ